MKKKFGLFFVGVTMLFLPGLSFSDTINLPETGQTACYDVTGNAIDCLGTAQDGEHQTGLPWVNNPEPRFSFIESGVIQDHLTGLEWLADGSCLGYVGSWYGALDRVAELNANPAAFNCGMGEPMQSGGWRLPSFNELRSLIHYGEPIAGEWLNTQGFVNYPAEPVYIDGGGGDYIDTYYWSSTTIASNVNMAWMVGFGNFPWMGGFEKIHDWGFNINVTAVRGSSTEEWIPARVAQTGQTVSHYPGDDGELQAGVQWKFEDWMGSERWQYSGAPNTVVDHLTGLVWTEDPHSPGPPECNPGSEKGLLSPYSNNDASEYINCLNNYNYLGSDNWRIPNIRELTSLIDAGSPEYFNMIFPVQDGDPFLSSTPHHNPTGPDGPYATWSLQRWDYGYTNIMPLANGPDRGFIWPVRSGEPQDTTPPVIEASVSPAANAAGWHNSDATVTFTCSDSESGIALCPSPVVVSSEGAGQDISGTATDESGNSASTSVTVSVDKTAPVITATAAPAPNSAGWNNGDVIVTFACSDNLSGIASCPLPVTVSTEGNDQLVSGTAFDLAGNSASTSVTVNIDKTAPEGTVTVSPDLLWPPNHKFVVITPSLSVSDNLDTDVTVSLDSITMDEGDTENTYYAPIDETVEDGFTLEDIKIEGGIIYLRAERAGNGDGRVYTLRYKLTDDAGNMSYSEATVIVPHSM